MTKVLSPEEGSEAWENVNHIVTSLNASTASVAHNSNLFDGEIVIAVFDACHSVCENRDTVDVCEMKLSEPVYQLWIPKTCVGICGVVIAQY